MAALDHNGVILFSIREKSKKCPFLFQPRSILPWSLPVCKKERVRLKEKFRLTAGTSQ